MGFFKFRKAEFYDKNGEYVGSKIFNKKDEKFVYNNKMYINDTKNTSYKLVDKWIYETRFYHYNVDSMKPLILTLPIKYSDITPEQFNVIIETDVLKKLNAVSNSWLKNINMKTVLIVALVGFAIFYLLKGGKII